MENLPDQDLHFIPSFLPEVILGTKEPNDKARIAAFDLLMTIAKRMEQGGKMNMQGFEADVEVEEKVGKKGKKAAPQKKGNFVDATVDELIKMVIAGLAGASPHMMSATVNCLSRLTYEYLGLFCFFSFDFDSTFFCQYFQTNSHTLQKF